MAGSLSEYAEKKLLDHWFKVASWTVGGSYYVGLSTADPLDTGAGFAAPAGNGYARAEVLDSPVPTKWNPAGLLGDVSISANTNSVKFAPASGAWGTVTHWGVFDALTSGNLLFYGTLGTGSGAIGQYEAPIFAAGDLDVTLSGRLDTTINGCLLEHLLGITPLAVPSNLYVALSTSDPGATGSTISEPAGGYERVLCNTWDSAAASNGMSRTANTNSLTFPIATAAWGYITWAALYSDLTGGTYYGRIQLSNPRAVVLGATARFAAGEIIFACE